MTGLLFAAIVIAIVALLLARSLKRRAGEATDFKLIDEEGKELTMAELHEKKQIIATIGKIVDDSVPPRPAKIHGKPEWTVDREGFVGVFPASDGMSATFKWLAGSESVVTATATVDADMSAGIKALSRSFDILPVMPEAGEAKAFELTVGPETDVT